MNTVASTPTAVEGIAEKTVIRIQAVSGLIFAVFLTMHLMNLVVGLCGQAHYDRFMGAMRWYYQFPLVEIFSVVVAAFVHMGAGLVRIRRRRRRAGTKSSPTMRVRLHRYSGYYLMAAFAGHVIATRGPGLLGHPADFSFVNFSLSQAGMLFYPYYFMLAVSGAYHLIHGVVVALRVVGVRLPKRLLVARSGVFWASATLCCLVALLAVLALGGQLYVPDQSRHPEWKSLVERMLPAAVRPW